eukprot:UN03917
MTSTLCNQLCYISHQLYNFLFRYLHLKKAIITSKILSAILKSFFSLSFCYRFFPFPHPFLLPKSLLC